MSNDIIKPGSDLVHAYPDALDIALSNNRGIRNIELDDRLQDIRESRAFYTKQKKQEKGDSIESKKEQIKNCFLSKGLLDYIPGYELQRLRFNLDEYINILPIYMPQRDIVESRKIYSNLKEKYEEAPKVLEEIRKIQIEHPMYDPYTLKNEQRAIYDKFLGHTIEPSWFPFGNSPLSGTILHYIHRTHIYPEGHANYYMLIQKVRDLLECWILAMSLFIPNIDNVGGKRKRRTRITKRKKNKKNKTRYYKK